MRDSYFVKNPPHNELEVLHELETSSALHENVVLVLASPPYSTWSARADASSAHDVFCRADIEDATRFMSNDMAPEANGHIFRSNLMLFY